MLGAQRILGLDLGASTIKVGEFQVTKGQGLRLLNFNHAELGLDPEHEENRRALLISTIRNVLREKGIKPAPTVFSVSGQSVFTRFVKLPPVDQSKVVQIIQYEAQQNVPFPIEEVCWDYQLIGSNAQGELEVVLLAIKNNIIEELHESVEEAGLRTVKVDVAPMALYNSVRYNYGDLDGCTVMLDIGARTTNLLFIEQNKLFSRSIPIAGNAITQSIAAEFNVSFRDAEQMKRSGFVALGGAYEEPADERAARISKIIRNIMTRLHAEVARSINFYRSQQAGSAPARLLLSGGSSIIPYSDRFFQEKLSVPIEYFNPFRNVEVDPKIPREELAGCAHFFGEVVGLGLRELTECPIEVNLLPTSLRSQRAGAQKRPYLAGAAVCVALIPMIWWIYASRITRLHRAELDDVKRQIQSLQKLKNEIEDEGTQLRDVQGRADQIVQLVDQAGFWPDLLQDLSRRLVPSLRITSLSLQGSTPISEGNNFSRGVPMPPNRRGGSRGELPGAPPMPSNMMGGMLPPGGPPPGGGLGATGSGGTGSEANELLIQSTGTHYNSAQDLTMVNQFANNLRESPFFDKEGVEILRLPDPMLREGEQDFTFSVRARLAAPRKI